MGVIYQADQQGDVLIENVRWLLEQGQHRDRIVVQTGRPSLEALCRALERLDAHELARRLRADPSPEGVNHRAWVAAPLTQHEVRHGQENR